MISVSHFTVVCKVKLYSQTQEFSYKSTHQNWGTKNINKLQILLNVRSKGINFKSKVQDEEKEIW